jgi:hypothetical protein
MFKVRLLVLLSVLTMAGCSPDPAARQRVTGNGAAVAGWPHHPTGDRFLIESCCTLRLAASARYSKGPGVDSIVHDVSGPGYVLNIVFGAYDSGKPQAGYQFEGRRIIDGVELNAFRWADRTRTPPEGRLLWLAQVGGGIIRGVEHSPWGLRIKADCTTPAACDDSAVLVGTIRF